MTLWAVVGWVVLVGLVLLVGSALAGLTGHAGIAVAQDALVYLLLLAWLVSVIALVTRSWALAAVGALLSVYHLVLLVPRLAPNRQPRWVHKASRFTVLVANVFVDNKTPGDLANVVVAAGADVIVIAEWNPVFTDEFDRNGGVEAYPHRLFDPDDRSDYAVAVVSRTALLAGSAMVSRGSLTVAQAVVDVGGQSVTIVGLNPMAVVDPDGYDTWAEQLDELIGYVPSLTGPVAVAGDLNTTTYRPKIRSLLRTGLRDAHESLGKGLSTSFKLAADGALAAPGTVARLDHVLTNDRVRAVSTEDLDSAGSDHVPFVMELAVRPERGSQRRAMPERRLPAHRGG